MGGCWQGWGLRGCLLWGLSLVLGACDETAAPVQEQERLDAEVTVAPDAEPPDCPIEPWGELYVDHARPHGEGVLVLGVRCGWQEGEYCRPISVRGGPGAPPEVQALAPKVLADRLTTLPDDTLLALDLHDGTLSRLAVTEAGGVETRPWPVTTLADFGDLSGFSADAEAVWVFSHRDETSAEVTALPHDGGPARRWRHTSDRVPTLRRISEPRADGARLLSGFNKVGPRVGRYYSPLVVLLDADLNPQVIYEDLVERGVASVGSAYLQDDGLWLFGLDADKRAIRMAVSDAGEIGPAQALPMPAADRASDYGISSYGSVHPLAGGDMVLGGESGLYPESERAVVTRVDGSGNPRWLRRFPWQWRSWVYALVPLDDGRLGVVVGATWSCCYDVLDNNDIGIVWLNADGTCAAP